MPTTTYATVDEYIAARPETVQPVLERVRGIIRKAAPGVEETISYGIPTFTQRGTYVVYLAGYKQHFSLHPVTDGLLESLGDELAPHIAGKGTMRFSLAEPVPAKLIERIVKVRAKEVAARAKSKAAGKR